MERKLKGENETVLMDKNAHVQFIYLFFIFLCWARCLFSFLSTQPNTLKKVFIPIFSSKFSIHPISPPNKHTLKSNSLYLLRWKLKEDNKNKWVNSINISWNFG